MRSLLLTFDIEPFVLGEDFDKSLSKRESDRLALEGLDRLAGFLEPSKVKATLFVPYDFSRLCRPQLKRLSGKGHEIGLHGFSHGDNYKELDDATAAKKLKQARESLERGFSVKVNGFRAPKLQAPKLSVLQEAGFLYDSSLHPTWLPGYYNNFFRPRNVFRHGVIKEVPISVAPLARLPFSWFFFRNLGLGYAKACSSLSLLNSSFLNLYFHNWEFLELESREFSGIPKRFRKNSGKKLAASLEKYVAWAKKKGLKGRTISSFLGMA